MRLLVTGFGPFPTMPRNPSARVAGAVAASRRLELHGVRADLRILTTAYAALAHELDPALATAPDAVLMIGVAGRSPRIRVERRATARRSTLFPDVAGETAGIARGPGFERRTRVVPVAALRLLREAGIPSRISRDCGRYLCNAAYFRALGAPCPVLFIHIPKPRLPRPGTFRRMRVGSGERLAAGLVDVALLALRIARVDAGRRRALQRT